MESVYLKINIKYIVYATKIICYRIPEIWTILKDLLSFKEIILQKMGVRYHFEKSLLSDNASAYQQYLPELLNILIPIRYLFFHH